MALRAVLAVNLRMLRASQKLSQETLAARAGLNRNYIGMLEREENAATIDAVEALAKALGVPPISLLVLPAADQDARKG